VHDLNSQRAARFDVSRCARSSADIVGDLVREDDAEVELVVPRFSDEPCAIDTSFTIARTAVATHR